MERVIDRKDYRRNSDNNGIIEEEQIDILQKKLRTFLNQSLIASIIFLIISFFRFYNCQDILNQINLALNNQITISSLKKSGQIIYNESIKYYTQLNDYIDNILQNNTNSNDNILNELLKSGEDINDIASNQSNFENLNDSNNINNIDNSTNEEYEDNSSASEFETAVEGVNQMSNDAKYIKENYKMTLPVIGTITSEFGVRNSSNPIVSNYHSGLDIAANTGTQILAALDGEVIEAATDTYYGKYLKIQKDDIVIIYAHCSKLLVSVGDKITRGKLIAYVGNTGNSTGPHLHFEIKYQNRLVNPLDILEI